jgi:hypothetical protein
MQLIQRFIVLPVMLGVSFLRPAFVSTVYGDASPEKEIAPRLVTLNETALPVRQVLKELARQTQITVEDRRVKDKEPTIALRLTGVPFWKALEEIAARANLRVSLFEADGKIALVDGPYRAMPVSFSGLFRVAVKRLVSVQDFETGSHVWTVHLEIATEPRFKPLFLDTKIDGLVVQDGKGIDLKHLPTGSGRVAVDRSLTVETQVRVEAPRDASSKIGLLKGSVALVGPSKMLTFTFDDLAPIDPAKSQQARKKTQDGVSVSLRRFKVEPARWTTEFLLEYPPNSPDFESFESWLVNNQIYLENKTTKERFKDNGGLESGDQSGHRAVLVYRFLEKDRLVLGKPGDWKLVYRTSGPIVRVSVPFEFRDLSLSVP